MKLKQNIFRVMLFYTYFNITNLLAMEIPNFSSMINYAESKVPSLDTITKFIISKGTKNNAIKIIQIPGFTLFQPYIPKAIYDFIGNLELKNIKSKKDPKTSDELISAQIDIPIKSGKSVPTDIRIVLGTNPIQEKTKAASNKTVQAPKSQGAWQEFESYFNITNYINYATSYVNSITDSIMKEFERLKFGIVIELPQGFKFATLSSTLSFLDVANFKQAALVIGTKFNDSVYGAIEPGFTSILKVQLQGPFIKLNNFIKNVTNNAYGIKQDVFELRGHILPSISGTELKTNPPGFKTKSASSITNLGKFIFNLGSKKFIDVHDLGIKLIALAPKKGEKTPSGYSLGLSGGLKLYLNNILNNNKLNPLDFTCFFTVDTALKAKLDAHMAGLLDLSAIGLPLKFGDISISEGLDLETMKKLNLNNFTITGNLDFGPKERPANLKTTFNINFNGKDTNIFAYGNLASAKSKEENALSLEDIFNLTKSAYKGLGPTIDKFKGQIPKFAIKNAQFYFTPVTLLYNNNKTLNAGITLNAALNIFGGSAEIDFLLDQTGFDAIGYITSEINAGPVKIGGAPKSTSCLILDTCAIECKGNPTAKTEKITLPTQIKSSAAKTFKLKDNAVPDILKSRTDFSKLKGGIVNIFFHPPKNIGMLINSKIRVDNLSIGTIDSDACINISTNNGVHASFEQQLFGLLDTQFTAYAKDYKKPTEWYICGKMTPKAENILGKAITDLINKAKAKAEKKIDDANNKVKGAKAAYDKALGAAQEKAKTAERDMKDKLEKAKHECGG